MTDKKIEEYLERAEKIIKNKSFKFSNTTILEIAKMIQIEEQHQDLLKLSRE